MYWDLLNKIQSCYESNCIFDDEFVAEIFASLSVFYVNPDRFWSSSILLILMIIYHLNFFPACNQSGFQILVIILNSFTIFIFLFWMGKRSILSSFSVECWECIGLDSFLSSRGVSTGCSNQLKIIQALALPHQSESQETLGETSPSIPSFF